MTAAAISRPPEFEIGESHFRRLERHARIAMDGFGAGMPRKSAAPADARSPVRDRQEIPGARQEPRWRSRGDRNLRRHRNGNALAGTVGQCTRAVGFLRWEKS